MIGHALFVFTPEQEDRVLLGKMEPWPEGAMSSPNPCLLITAYRGGGRRNLVGWPEEGPPDSQRILVGRRFDALCHRFGADRITAAIRNRILSNRARRELTRPGLLGKPRCENESHRPEDAGDGTLFCPTCKLPVEYA